MGVRIDVIDVFEDHVILTADSPARFEVSLLDGRIVVHGYTGDRVDMDQDPDAVYDGTMEAGG